MLAADALDDEADDLAGSLHARLPSLLLDLPYFLGAFVARLVLHRLHQRALGVLRAHARDLFQLGLLPRRQLFDAALILSHPLKRFFGLLVTGFEVRFALVEDASALLELLIAVHQFLLDQRKLFALALGFALEFGGDLQELLLRLQLAPPDDVLRLQFGLFQ